MQAENEKKAPEPAKTTPEPQIQTLLLCKIVITQNLKTPSSPLKKQWAIKN